MKINSRMYIIICPDCGHEFYSTGEGTVRCPVCGQKVE